MAAIGDAVTYVGGRGTGITAGAYRARIVETPETDETLPADSAALEITARGRIQIMRALRSDAPAVGRWHEVTP